MTANNNRRGLAFEIVGWLMLLVLGGVSFASSMIHLGNPYYFLDSVLAYDLLRERYAILAAAYLPYLELVLSIAIWLPEFRRAALIGMLALFSAYSVAQGIALSRGLKISCGCFGPASDRPISIDSLAFAASLAAISLLSLFFFATRRLATKQVSHA